MASAKSRRYGQGGSKHPKGFSLTLRRLVTTDVLKGTSFISG